MSRAKPPSVAWIAVRMPPPPEVVGAEDAGGDDRERPCIDPATVVEAVDDAARDAEHLARADVDRRALERPGQYAVESVARLLVAVVAVCGCDLRAGGDVELAATDPADCSPSSRKRIAMSPTLISLCVLAAMVSASRFVW